MCGFEPRRLNKRTSNLVTGTSRKNIKANEVEAAIHSYRGSTLKELCKLIEIYPQPELYTIVIVAGFQDHHSFPQVLPSTGNVLSN